MFSVNYLLILKILSIAILSILFKRYTTILIKKQLTGISLSDSVFYKISNSYLRNFSIYLYFTGVTLVSTGLLSLFFLDYFLNFWIIISVFSIPIVLVEVRKEIRATLHPN